MEIQLWREVLEPYALAVDELMVKFQHIQEQYKKISEYCPIELVEGRVKSIASIMEKSLRKHIALDQLEEQMRDIAGMRLICQFVEDCYQVRDLIKKRTDMVVINEEDYIAEPKQSGYRSLHMTILYTVQTLQGPKAIYVEIQIRTMGMDCWSTIEHSLQYKYRYHIPNDMSERLQEIAKGMLQNDRELSEVRDDIMLARNEKMEMERIVVDILNTIQNLYRMVSRREAGRIQEEFHRIYREENLEKLKRFATELDIIAEGYRAQSLK